MKNMLKISRKFLVLGVMLFILGFVTYSDSLAPEAGAAPCCSSCEVYPGDDEITYCENYCETSDRGCYQSCIRRVHNCWQWCNFGC